MKLSVIVILIFAGTVCADTNVCGNISGIWDLAGSPYYVTCDVTVPAGETLEIRPGVTVRALGAYAFNINGLLRALGSETDSIIFTSDSSPLSQRWQGLRFEAADDSSLVGHCIFENAYWPDADGNSQGGGVNCRNCSPTISHCTIRYNQSIRNGGGIGGYQTNCIIYDCVIADNVGPYGGGLGFGPGSPLIRNCVIMRNSAGQGGGAGFWGGTPTFTNCILALNQSGDAGGLRCADNGYLIVRNCIFVGNMSYADIALWGTGATIEYNDFWLSPNFPVRGNGAIPDSIGITTRLNFNGDPCDRYYNILLDPRFMNQSGNDFHLLEDSPCIDAGDPNSPFDADWSRVDMGAFPYLHFLPPLMVLEPNGGEEWTLYSTDTVRWQADSVLGEIMIELNRDYPNGGWEILDTATVNDGMELVEVLPPLSVNCRVRVSAVEDTFSDISNGNFSITSSQGFLALIRDAQPNTTVLNWNAGTVECPADFSETFRLKNFGSQQVIIFRPQTLAGPDFFRTTTIPVRDTLSPMEISAGSVTLTYDPVADGTQRDTLRIQTDASNGTAGFLKISLMGTRVTTPAAPEIVIEIAGEDAVLHWDAVTESVGGCAVDVTGYLVFYAGVAGGPYWYHGFTTDTSYTHVRVVHYNYGMFYHVVATEEPVVNLIELPVGVREEDLVGKGL